MSNIREISDRYFGEQFEGFSGMVSPRIRESFEKIVDDAIFELEEIARRAGAWKTADDRWVYGEDMVYYRMHNGNKLCMKAKDVNYAVRGKYYSYP